MNILKKIIIAIFCPILFVFDGNGTSKIKGNALIAVKILFAAAVTTAIIVFAYYLHKEIL